MTKWIVAAVGLGLLLLVSGFFLLPHSIPDSYARAYVEDIISKRFNLSARIAGDLSYTIFPDFNITATDVRLEGTPKPLISVRGRVGEISFQANSSAILGGAIEIDHFRMSAPAIEVTREVSPVSWDAQSAQSAMPTRHRLNLADELWNVLTGVIVSDAAISDGALRYVSTELTQPFVAEGINFSISKPEGVDDFMVQGRALVNGRSVDLSSKLADIPDFLKGMRTEFTVRLNSGPVTVEFNGSAARRQIFVIEGQLRSFIPSIDSLKEWLGIVRSEDDSYMGSFRSEAKLVFKDNKIRLSDMDISASGQQLKGEVSLDFSRPVPTSDGRLKLSTITLPDFKSWLGNSQEAKGPLTVFDLSPLRWLDGNWMIAIDSVWAGAKSLGSASFNLTLRSGRLTMELGNENFFGGKGKFRLQIAREGDTPTFDLFAETIGSDLDQLSDIFLTPNSLTGNANIRLELSTRGETFDTIAAQLRGRGDITVLDGTLANKDITLALFDGDPSVIDIPNARFGIRIDHGTAILDETKIVAPAATVIVKGRLDLPQKFINVRVSAPDWGSVDEKAERVAIIAGPIDEISVFWSDDQALNAIMVPSVEDRDGVKEQPDLQPADVPLSEENDTLR